MKIVSVTVVLKVEDDTRIEKWLPDAIQQELVEGEELLGFEQEQVASNL